MQRDSNGKGHLAHGSSRQGSCGTSVITIAPAYSDKYNNNNNNLYLVSHGSGVHCFCIPQAQCY